MTVKRNVKKVPAYAIVSNPVPCCRVLVIELVLDTNIKVYDTYHKGNGIDNIEIDDVLSELVEYGAAEVVEHFYVSTKFDDTCGVLARRRAYLDD